MNSPRRTVLALCLAFAPAVGAASETDAWTIAGPPGASVYAIVPAPSRPDTVFVGTSRGVWRGSRGGLGWTEASGGLPAATVQAVAVDPGDADTLYAGTRTPPGTPSLGIFKSLDGGQTWAVANVGLSDPFTGIEPLDVAALSIDPSDPRVVLAGTRFSEIFRSVDGGATWTPRTFGGYGLGLETTAFVRQPDDPRRVYAASTRGLLLSLNGGESWSFFGDAGVSLFSLAVDPVSPRTLWGGNATGFGVGRSIDGGAHWSSANGDLPLLEFGGVSFYPAILAVAVDPDGSSVTIATQGRGIFRSTDAGATWTPVNGGLPELDFRALAFLPGSTELLAGGNGGGVYRTSDAAAGWSRSSFGLEEALVSAVAANPGSPGVAYAAAYDGVWATSDGGRSWTRATGGLPPEPAADLVLRYVVSIQPGDTETLFAATLGGGLWKSVDGGETWTAGGTGLDDAYPASIALASNSTVLYAGTDHPYDGSNPQRVYRSADAGATWQRTGLDAGGFPIESIAIDPSDADRAAAISRGAGFYFETSDGGATWATVAPGGGCGGVNAVLYAPGGARVLAAVNNGVCISEDGGANWTLHEVAPLAAVFDLLADPSNPAVLYAAAEPARPAGAGGVFRSTDGGATWMPFGTGLESFAVRSLALDASGERFYAGILGGGVAALSLGPPERGTPDAVPQDRATRIVPPR